MRLNFLNRFSYLLDIGISCYLIFSALTSPPPHPRPLKMSNSSFLLLFWSNLSHNIFMHSPLMKKIIIWKERKWKFESDNVLDLVRDNHCHTRSYFKRYDIPFQKLYRVKKTHPNMRISPTRIEIILGHLFLFHLHS